jgi:hypothetical protein
MHLTKINYFMKVVKRLFVSSVKIGFFFGFFFCNLASGQNTTPTIITDQNLNVIPGSASAGASLFNGTAGFSLPVYTIKCGSLSLPITLDYNYNGLLPMQEAGWTGLGWNLEAGGVINRIIQGAVDSSKNFGKNYGQYSISDSLFKTVNTPFINNLYANDKDTTYDTSPDIFDCSFNGYSVKFYWVKGKAYMLSYNKQLSISWPSINGSIFITTGDGTVYTFGQAAGVLQKFSSGTNRKNYNASWYLSSIISADKNDTVLLSYTTYTTRESVSWYNNSYPQGTFTFDGSFTDTLTPIVTYPLISSISCRTTRVNFIPDPTLRTDQRTNGSKLREIDVTDLISGNIIKKNFLSYEYLGQTSNYPQYYERLKLKTFSAVNPLSVTDSQTYSFSYIQEYGSFPVKNTLAIDDWGYYNGLDANPGQLITANNHFYRNPNFNYCSYGALDTVRYPTGGYSTYQYELNDYDSSSTQHNAPGPGIRVKAIADYIPGATVNFQLKVYQ